MRVLVTGASGFVGSHLVPALLGRGHDVVALTRDPATYVAPAGVEVVEGDVLDPDLSLPAVDAAYYLVHSMAAGEDFEERDRRAARNFRRAVDAAGIERVVYLGGLGNEERGLSEHLQSRREVERLLGGGDAALTALRAAIVIGEGSASFRIIRQLAARLPVMVTPSWVRTECQPIYIDDVVAYLVGVLEAPATTGETYEIGGPDVLTYQEILTTTARILVGRPPLIVPVPVLSPGLSARWLGLVTDVPVSVAKPLVDGLKNRVVVTDHSIDDHVRPELTGFEESVRLALGEDSVVESQAVEA
ncbi:NAD(P)H-binding protein [Haloarcula onubensis]|uniref:NAD(P)H-binding protein n=1 Tax=Haloarcula onubensis TaxID=2950539 RepID=A0ABU2FK48_9EURY|nr:NAD(P)H-binding protein [Halomicroarcula sp. S3CR25-11]MDS0280566.1 NAD(P)H-binding protein [Halomicroarcula sp. S3CR25-11]